jgi:hypothetical protein
LGIAALGQSCSTGRGNHQFSLVPKTLTPEIGEVSTRGEAGFENSSGKTTDEQTQEPNRQRNRSDYDKQRDQQE